MAPKKNKNKNKGGAGTPDEDFDDALASTATDLSSITIKNFKENVKVLVPHF